MSEALFDTSILVDALKGHSKATAELARSSRRWISRITWIEVMAGAAPGEEERIAAFLDFFTITELSEEVAERAALIRCQYGRLTLADAIVWASAQVGGRILVTRNTRDLPARMPGIRIPYTV